ncbi:MAG: hypothetical protein C4318_00415 [Acidimicrobiia bacterium]
MLVTRIAHDCKIAKRAQAKRSALQANALWLGVHSYYLWRFASWVLVFLVIAGCSQAPSVSSKPSPSTTDGGSLSSSAPPQTNSSGANTSPASDEYVVVRAIDGDTIDVRAAGGGAIIRVRLIGIDTPETKDPRRPVECFGEEAAKFTSRLVGKLVRLEFDVERVDRYGRTLAYVYLSDGTFFNLLLVEEGYALPYTVPPNVRHADQFVEAARRAREAGKGLWGKC